MKNFEIDAIVEIPHGSMFKYEVDKKSGRLTVDRPLTCPIPYNYGYVPNTLHGDGDPLDICILSSYPVQALTQVKVRIIGAFICNDNGSSDDKLIGIISGDETTDMMKKYMIDQVEAYLSTYKTGFVIERRALGDEAMEIVMKDLVAYDEQDS